MDEYVPAIIKNVPRITSITLQDDNSAHFRVGRSRPAFQLSNSHMQPIGW
jgi:hypothetical protein